MSGKIAAAMLVSLAGMNATAEAANVRIAIHGGAGTLLREKLTPEMEQAYRQALEQSLKAGYAVLMAGGSSIDAVQAAIVVLEDSPLFNAGKGAVFTHDRTNEMDASIMEGATLKAGAAAGVTTVRNPIRLAAAVMNQSRHVMLSGRGAEQFAASVGLEIVDPSYFRTERRWNEIMELLKTRPGTTSLSEDPAATNTTPAGTAGRDQASIWPDDHKFGTVGAVALDSAGNLAAGTSTGGMTNKRWGRIGDSPVIGAGTYADNNACAISATGHGEFFIRAAVAHDICARVLYKRIPLQQAADEVVQDKLVKMRGDGGIIGIDPQGNVVFSFNTPGMYRGHVDRDGKVHTAVFK